MGTEELKEEDFGEQRIAALRVEVAAKMAELRLSNGAVAKEAGVGNSTVSAWLAGKYTGDNAATALKLQRWLTSRTARARTQGAMRVAPGFTWTPTARAVVAVLEHAQFSPALSVFCGAPGIGKTITARQYDGQHGNIWMITAEPVGGGPRALLEELADEVGVAALGNSGHRVSKAIVRKIAGSGGLIIVDEAQHLSSVTLDQLRTIQDLSNVGVALLGNPVMNRKFDAGPGRGQFAQLSSRISMNVMRPHCQRGDVDALLDAWSIEAVGIRQLCQAVARRGGALRAMTNVLRQAHLRADGNGEALSEDHVLSAAQQLGAAPDLEAAA